MRQLYDFTLSGSYPNAEITYSNLGKNGNAANGKDLYTNKCSDCHGKDGTENAMMSLGSYVRSMPYMVAQYAKFGFLGTDMHADSLSLQQLNDLFKTLADETNFP